jgi:hypothetical protein
MVVTTIQHFAVTTDGWKSENDENYVTITASCIFLWFFNGNSVDLTETFKLVSMVLKTIMQASHVGVEVAEVILEVLNDWNLTNKLIAIVTDNAANMGTMYDALMQKCSALQHGGIKCFAHSLHLAVLAAIEECQPVAGNQENLLALLMRLRCGWIVQIHCSTFS